MDVSVCSGVAVYRRTARFSDVCALLTSSLFILSRQPAEENQLNSMLQLSRMCVRRAFLTVGKQEKIF